MEIFTTMCLLTLYYGFLCLCKSVLQKRDQSCYLLAYECYEAREDMKVNSDSCAKIVMQNKNLGLEELRFLLKTIVNSGIGEETSCPRNIIEVRSSTMEDELREMDGIIFDTLDKLFAGPTFNFSFTNRHSGCQCVHALPCTLSNISYNKSLEDEGGHQDLQPLRNGMQCKSHCY